jgi:hypothetical protein
MVAARSSPPASCSLLSSQDDHTEDRHGVKQPHGEQSVGEQRFVRATKGQERRLRPQLREPLIAIVQGRALRYRPLTCPFTQILRLIEMK